MARLKATGAKLVWCSTTPVPEGAARRVPEDVPVYNAVAKKIMAAHGVPINDLYAFALPRLAEIQRPSLFLFAQRLALGYGRLIASRAVHVLRAATSSRTPKESGTCL